MNFDEFFYGIEVFFYEFLFQKPFFLFEKKYVFYQYSKIYGEKKNQTELKVICNSGCN